MALIVTDQPAGPRKEFPIPSEGTVLIVLADVQDLGVVQNEYYGSRKEVALSWVINEKDPDGNFFVIRRSYTASVHEKSNLYADLRDMLGRNPKSSEDLESFLGHVNIGVIKQVKGTGKNEGKTFANIKAFLAAKPEDKFAVPADFVREKDGGKYGKAPRTRDNSGPVRGSGVNVGGNAVSANTQKPTAPPPQEVDDSDIPF